MPRCSATPSATPAFRHRGDHSAAATTPSPMTDANAASDRTAGVRSPAGSASGPSHRIDPARIAPDRYSGLILVTAANPYSTVSCTFSRNTGPARTVNREGKRLPLSQFMHTVNVYLNSAFAVTSQAAEAMAANEPLASNQRGVIINTASIAGYEGQPGQAGYSAAKGGIIGMTLTIARDLAPLGIRAVAIAPGTFLTLAYSSRMTDEQAQAHWGPMVPNPKRMGDPDEYGILAAHIVDNDFLNGTTIRLDGAQRF